MITEIELNFPRVIIAEFILTRITDSTLEVVQPRV